MSVAHVGLVALAALSTLACRAAGGVRIGSKDAGSASAPRALGGRGCTGRERVRRRPRTRVPSKRDLRRHVGAAVAGGPLRIRCSKRTRTASRHHDGHAGSNPPAEGSRSRARTRCDGKRHSKGKLHPLRARLKRPQRPSAPEGFAPDAQRERVWSPRRTATTTSSASGSAELRACLLHRADVRSVHGNQHVAGNGDRHRSASLLLDDRDDHRPLAGAPVSPRVTATLPLGGEIRRRPPGPSGRDDDAHAVGPVHPAVTFTLPRSESRPIPRRIGFERQRRPPEELVAARRWPLGVGDGDRRRGSPPTSSHVGTSSLATRAPAMGVAGTFDHFALDASFGRELDAGNRERAAAVARRDREGPGHGRVADCADGDARVAGRELGERERAVRARPGAPRAGSV